LIGKAGKPVVRLIAYQGAAKARVPGILAGKITIHDDSDGPLPPEIGEAFGISYEAKRPIRKPRK